MWMDGWSGRAFGCRFKWIYFYYIELFVVVVVVGVFTGCCCVLYSVYDIFSNEKQALTIERRGLLSQKTTTTTNQIYIYIKRERERKKSLIHIHNYDTASSWAKALHHHLNIIHGK